MSDMTSKCFNRSLWGLQQGSRVNRTQQIARTFAGGVIHCVMALFAQAVAMRCKNETRSTCCNAMRNDVQQKHCENVYNPCYTVQFSSNLLRNTPVSRYFNTTVQFDKRRICTGLISIWSAYNHVKQ